MDLVDVTIVNVAVPSLMSDLGAGYSAVEWIIAGYVLAFGSTLITGGRLGDRFGRKRVFLVGLLGFTAASTVCGLASNSEMLVAARFLQGAMAGMMVPQILAIIHGSFPPGPQRRRVFGLFSAVMGVAGAVGLVAGGVLITGDVFGWGWRSIFLVNVPVGLVAAAVAAIVIPESRSAHPAKLDLVGAGLSIAALGLLIYPLMEGHTLGWPIWTFGLLGAAVVVFVCFILFERRRAQSGRSPLILLRIFGAASFSAGTVAWLAFWVATGGFFFVWSLYLQIGLNWSALHAGLTALWFSAGVLPAAALSVQVLTPRLGRPVLTVGILLYAVGLGSYAWLCVHDGAQATGLRMAVPLVVIGIGFGLFVGPILDVILTDVDRSEAGSASGIVNTAQQVGVALGVAVTGALFATRLAVDPARGVDAVAPGLRDAVAGSPDQGLDPDVIIAQLSTCLEDRSRAVDPTITPQSCRAGAEWASALPADLQAVIARAGSEANAVNFSHTFASTLLLSIALLAAVAIALQWTPLTPRPRDFDAEATF